MKRFIVKLMNGMKYVFFVEPDESVASIKCKIECCLDIKKETMRLLYQGALLQDYHTLFKLPDNSILHLVLQLASIQE